MAETNALATFQFPKNKGLFVTFESGDEFKLRVLTVDPVVTNKEFTAPNGDINISTKFAFIVWNYTLGRAQILNAGATITREIQRLHQDEDFGANIKNIDIKIKADGEKLNRKYTITALPKAETLTNDQIRECQAINLDDKVTDGQRMSFYKPEEFTPAPTEQTPGYDQAKAVREALDAPEVDIDEPINLDDIPF